MIVNDSSPGGSHLPETASTTETADPAPPYDPPEYTPQSQFRVGKATTTAPFVTPSQIRTHLGLLRVFTELELKIKAPPAEDNAFPLLAGKLDSDSRWVWFLELALERYAVHRLSPFKFHNELRIVPSRFSRWTKAVGVSLTAMDNPPLDVWLIWHAYMLNPT